MKGRKNTRFALSVPCSECGAAVGERCATKGKEVIYGGHSARLAAVSSKKPAKLTKGDIDDFNTLPPKEKIKAWESLKRLEQAGELEPIAGKIEKPEGA
jgi:hypothetical protein